MFCCVPGCTSRYGKDKISFHQFPKNNPARMAKWIEAVGGKMAEASSGAFVCGRHFVAGKAARNADTDSPDWIPTLYMDGTGPPGDTSATTTHQRRSDGRQPKAAPAAEEADPLLDFDDEPNVRCLVRGCAMARDDDHSSMLFFPVPATEPDRSRWFQLMGLAKGPPVNSRPPAAVCELHFELAKDLANYDDFITLGVSGVLRPGVLPTRNVPGTLEESKPFVQEGQGEQDRSEHEADSSLLQEMSVPMDTTNGDEMMPDYPDHMQASPVEEFVHVCRSCLSTDRTNLVSGFEDNLVDIFFQFTNVTISKSEGISTDFCHDCRNRLMELHFFRDTCLTSTQILIHRYQKSHGMVPDDDDAAHGDVSMMDYGNGSLAGHHTFDPDDPEDLLVPQKEEAFWDNSDSAPNKPRRGRPPRSMEPAVVDDWAEKSKRKLVKKRYHCKVCFKEYNSRVGLDTHQATHKNDDPAEFTVPCEKCPVMRRPGDRHSCHVNAMHCHMCPDQFRSWSYLKIHLAKVHRIKTKRRELMAMMKLQPGKRGRRPSDIHDFSGNFSGSNSTMISSSSATSTPRQPQSPAVQAPFHKCGFCDAAFRIRATLDAHLRTHSLVQLTECSECGVTCDSFRALERHFDQHADHSSDTKSGLLNKCHMCGKVLRRRQTLMLHRQYVHCDREIVKCSTCPRLFSNARNLVKHQCPARGKQPADQIAVGGNINGDFIIVKPESILKGGNPLGDERPDSARPVATQEDNNADPLLGLGNEDIIDLGSDDDDDSNEEEDDESSNQTSKSAAFTCDVCGKVFEKEDVLDRHMKLHRMMNAANARK
uniref:Uncharacterized protein n=1 Tax=Culex tarsalis TaxID=7177 RepID=A0A1Q3EZA0_CULTA